MQTCGHASIPSKPGPKPHAPNLKPKPQTLNVERTNRGCVFAFCLGLLQSIIGSEKGPAKQFEEKLLSVKQYLLFRISDRDLTRNVLAWYGTCWRISGTPFNEVRPKP